MEFIGYWLARGLIALIQMFPLTGVVRAGRAIGQVCWWLDARHRRVAIDNLTHAFGTEKSAREIRALAHENYLRLAENFLSLAKTGAMTDVELAPHLEWRGVDRLQRPSLIAVAHFGNFELYTRLPAQLPARTPPWKLATTFRALNSPGLNDLMQRLRQRWGILFFERRTGAEQLKEALATGQTLLLLLADQHAGDRGLWLPFMGRDCSCSPSPAVLALRYDMPLVPALCHRDGTARWRIEFKEEIPTRTDGRRRSVEAVTRELNAVFEAEIRRDPANWFWVHRRWKPASPYQQGRTARAPAEIAPASPP